MYIVKTIMWITIMVITQMVHILSACITIVYAIRNLPCMIGVVKGRSPLSNYIHTVVSF